MAITTTDSTTSTSGGTTTSFSNTPQATNDLFSFSEDVTGTVGAPVGVLILDVMANDLGGTAKQLYSLDDGSSPSTGTKLYAPSDLLSKDLVVTGDAIPVAATC